MTRRTASVVAAVAAALMAAGTSACGSSAGATPCAPSTAIAGGGEVRVVRADGEAAYAMSTAEVEDFLNSGSATITAGASDAGAPSGLAPGDVVAVLRLDPVSDVPGTYALDSLHAAVGFCDTSGAALVFDGSGNITGCRRGSAKPATEKLAGTFTVTSSSNKSLDAPLAAGGHVSVEAQFGAGDPQCKN
jgi:hypothetical protein